ncbi:cation diffusion facilitator family transporter [Methylobacterium pseudosasicola]|uniref:Cation diffusion facilitator family transporter n=1 Tax=Methylobacterium pseudosasicola TaxID=582667 RepID=A0A1I4F6L9_9HYPH|nr:cation diffusion facilitator family transporter [Methylobacterium pseudosasicola]SFL13632.1 cation diffusion facilitator family transporter [Methylobacterium pseudosasicola]
MAHESTGAIYAAAGANLAIAAAKFVGGALTGSTAMLAEGVHSVVDTANQVLLLLGMKRAKKPADTRHPFGYGREIYFYAFVVALMIFLGGGLFAVYEGIERVRHPSPDADAHLFGYTVPGIWVNVAILGFAIAAEGVSWIVAMRQFWAEKGKSSAMRAIRRSKDPTLFTILAEDTAALIGLLIAFAGVVLAYWLDKPSLDGWASVGIGFVLVGMAVFLMIETHGLLIGEAADPAVVAAISELVRAEPGVLHLNEVLTQHLGPTDILVNLSIDMADDLSAGEVESLVTRLDRALKQRNPEVTRVFIEIQTQADHAVRAAA